MSAAEYMALPASQYSVLDARKIERLDDDTFRCYVGGLKFFGIRIEPVLTVSVVVGSKGPTVSLLATTVSLLRTRIHISAYESHRIPRKSGYGDKINGIVKLCCPVTEAEWNDVLSIF